MNQPEQPPQGQPPPGYPQQGYGPQGYGPQGYGPQGPMQGPPKRSGAKTALIVVGVIAGVCVLANLGKSGGGSGSGGGSSTSGGGSSTSGGAAGDSVASAVPMNTPFDVAGLEAVVQTARFAPSVSGSVGQHTAGEGATLVILTYRVRNTTNEPIQALSFADAVIINGATFQPSMQCNMAVNTLGITDTLNPNLPRTFEACFEVPANSRGVVVKFNRSLTDRYAQTGL